MTAGDLAQWLPKLTILLLTDQTYRIPFAAKTPARRLARYQNGRPRVVSRCKFKKRRGDLVGCADLGWGEGWKQIYFTMEVISVQALAPEPTLLLRVTSAEPELYVMRKCPAQIASVISDGKDFRVNLQGTVLSDATAGIAFAYRQRLPAKRGTSNVPHLWMQDALRDKELHVPNKVDSTRNPADMCSQSSSRTMSWTDT